VVSFQRCFPEAKVIGTDLFPRHGKASYWQHEVEIVKHDFMQQRSDWVGHWDVVYSNSLDHAYDPSKCITTWLDQLTAQGRLFVQWTWAHRSVTGGDCFGASLDEYIALFMQHGYVEDVIATLYAKARRVTHSFVIVIRKRTRREQRMSRW